MPLRRFAVAASRTCSTDAYSGGAARSTKGSGAPRISRSGRDAASSTAAASAWPAECCPASRPPGAACGRASAGPRTGRANAPTIPSRLPPGLRPSCTDAAAWRGGPPPPPPAGGARAPARRPSVRLVGCAHGITRVRVDRLVPLIAGIGAPAPGRLLHLGL